MIKSCSTCRRISYRLSLCEHKITYITNNFITLCSLQLHIVHMKHHYVDIKTALSDPEGIAVLGFFYEVTVFYSVFLK